MADKVDKKKAFMRASIEMLEDAEQRVKDKYSKYENTEDTMNDIVSEIRVANEINQNAAKNAGYSEDELRNAEYTKVSGLEVEKYERYLKKIGMTDEQMHNKAFGEEEARTVIASSETKKKKVKGFFTFSKKKEETEENKDVLEFDLTKRTVKGEGYVDNVVDMEAAITDSETVNEEQSKTESEVKSDVSEEVKQVYNKPDINTLEKTTTSVSDFDMQEVSPMTRYDIIELPSHGECYPSKKGRLPVRELTAADENLIASPNMYVSGMLIDTLIRRCVLDKSFDTEQLCEGDKDAIVLWLRATAFGQEYNVTAKNPETGKEYKANINLGDFKYKEFNLKGDENGHFEYRFSNGDIAKFKVLSSKEIQEVQDEVASQYINQKKYLIYDMIGKIRRQVDEIFMSEEGDEPLLDAVDYITDWANKGVTDAGYADKLYDEFVTKSMEKRTFSVNGNEDRKFVSDYISSLPMSESRRYRDYMFSNIPGIDFSFEMPIPESDGGGSFTSFLRYDDTVFIG